jgi:hypothetical protein
MNCHAFMGLMKIFLLGLVRRAIVTVHLARLIPGPNKIIEISHPY